MACGGQLWMWYAPFGVGGVERFLLGMAQAGAEGMSIAAVSSAEGAGRVALEAAGARCLDWSFFWPAYMGQSADGADACRRLGSELAVLQPRLLVLNDCTDFGLGVLPLLEWIRPYCTILDVLHIDSPRADYLSNRRPLLRVLDGVVGTNRSILDRWRRDVEPSRVPLRYIANGVTVPALPRSARGSVLRLLYVGRIVQEQKRVLELPAVLRGLESAGREWSLTLVGDGPERAALEAALVSAGVRARVRFTGALAPPAVLPLYFEHDVLLNLSSYEGFSMALIEALAAGCVPVCTDLPCLDRSILRDGENCRLFPLERPGAASGILAGLDGGQLARMSEAARRAGEPLTAERALGEYDAFVRELRERRPLSAWPEKGGRLGESVWDMSRLNPWVPHVPRWRRWVPRGLRRILGGRA